MRNRSSTRFIFMMLSMAFAGLFLITCERLNIVEVIKIVTLSAKSISDDTAVGYGNVIDDGGGSMIEKGICWDTLFNPTIYINHKPSENTTNPFFSILRGLRPGTEYHARAYTRNGDDIIYGNDVPFKTLPLGIDAVFEKLEEGSAPIIDGTEEDLWNNVFPVRIEKDFPKEFPTVTAYWKGMWDDTCVYVLVNVEDDNNYPVWKGGAGDGFNYDRVELYFDLNNILADGQGPEYANSGHWQAPAEIWWSDNYSRENYRSWTNGQLVSHYQSYGLIGANCTYEFRIPKANLTDKNTDPLSVKDLNEKVFGFDITVTDLDKGITTQRQRRAWMNNQNGPGNESWYNMNTAGKIVFR